MRLHYIVSTNVVNVVVHSIFPMSAGKVGIDPGRHPVGGPIYANNLSGKEQGGQGGGSKSYDDIPEVCCVYSNKEDPRSFICAKDPCGKRVPVCNVAHPAGMVGFGAFYGSLAIFLVLRLFVLGGRK